MNAPPAVATSALPAQAPMVAPPQARRAAPRDAMILMGRVAGPFAVNGWVKIQVFTERVDGLLGYRDWWLQRDGRWQQVAVEEAAVHGRVLVAKLTGCEDREAAAALRGSEVAVPRAALPRNEDGEYYWADLEGLRVHNLQNQDLGRITGLIDTGANQVLVVRGERERLIPFVSAVVESVDLARGEVAVDWGADW
ncbi:MAG TPA: ribosome maturation factor RimM [Burkholderiales bacterium]|nr:ribosome maturation factor RimM [Burkholderiales bacterium]